MIDDNKCMFEYGDFVGVIDTGDYLFMEKLEAARDALEADKDLTGIDTESARIKKVVAATGNFFDMVFGEGAANKAFGTATSLDVVLDAMAALTAAIVEQSAASEKAYNALGKYTPNRAQRRAQK